MFDGSLSVSSIQDYFENILKKHTVKNDYSPTRIYVSKITKRIAFRIKTGYDLELLTAEMMKLLGSIKSKIRKDENGKSMPHLESTEVV